MRRESDNGFVCGTCGETVYLDECGCTQSIESLPESDWQAMLGAMFQRILAESYARARTRNLTGFLQQSSPLVGIKRLTQSFDELETS